jgi:ribosomal protein S18 acetylase RimI-like enzyme
VVSVVQVGSEHVDALTGLIREAWDPGATAESVAASRALAAQSNPVAPNEPPPTFLLLSGDEAVGHVTSYPIRLWDGAIERPAHWLKGLMVLPRHRNGPVGFLVLREALRHLGAGDTAALVVEPAAIRLFTALGFVDMGLLANRVKLLRPGAALRRLDFDALGWRETRPRLALALRVLKAPGAAEVAGAFVALGTKAWSVFASGAARGFRVADVDSVDPTETDALWSSVRRGVRTAPARDAHYLRRRYGAGDPYRFVTARRDERLVGVAVVRRQRAEADARLRGIRVATLSDVLFEPGSEDAGVALVAAAERTASRMGADALLCSASHEAVNRALQRRAFIEAPPNVHLVVRPAPGAPPLSDRLDQWWLTRGDSDADEVF